MSKSKQSKQERKRQIGEVSLFDRNLLWLIVIPVLLLLVYKPVSKFGMINWDEKRYLMETPFVQDISFANVKQMFTQKVLNSYNPLMLLSFSIDYKLAKNDFGWYHAVNLFFHILNSLLLYACLRKIRLRPSAAGIVTALFAFNPLAVEAVVWIAARKDVLYVFFYFLSWLSYLKFSESAQKRFYFIALLFGLMSLLSKLQAISLPFLFLLSDYLLNNKIDWKNLTNKIPFICMSILFGWYAVAGSTLVADKYSVTPTIADKLIYSVMAFGMYVEKLFIPTGLSVIHQFPEKGSSDYILYFIIGVLSILLFIYTIIRFFKKAPYVTGGLLFFIIHIFIVLHIVAYNSALIYERFAYVAAIGIFIVFVKGEEIFPGWEKYKMKILLPLVAIMMLFTIQRIPVWKDSESLWSDAIAKEPNAEQAYNNRGQFYDGEGRYEEAFADFKSSIRIQPRKPDAWNNLSVYYFRKADWKNALIINDTVLAIEPRSVDGLSNRGGIYFNQELYDSAIVWYSKIIPIAPQYSAAYYNIGAAYFKLKQYLPARNYFYSAITSTPNYSKAETFLALTYARLNMPDSVVFYAQLAAKYDLNAGAYRAASMEYIVMGNKTYADGDTSKALEYYLNAGIVDPSNADAYYDAGGVYLMMKNIEKARACWQKSISINPEHKEASAWLEKTK